MPYKRQRATGLALLPGGASSTTPATSSPRILGSFRGMGAKPCSATAGQEPGCDGPASTGSSGRRAGSAAHAWERIAAAMGSVSEQAACLGTNHSCQSGSSLSAASNRQRQWRLPPPPAALGAACAAAAHSQHGRRAPLWLGLASPSGLPAWWRAAGLQGRRGRGALLECVASGGRRRR